MSLSKVSPSPLFFNSKAKENWPLSNFYGGVEECYQGAKFKHPKVRKFIKRIRRYDMEKFSELMILLEKNASYWTKKHKDGDKIPILGIAAKIISNLLKNGKRPKYAKIVEKLTKHIGVNVDDFFQTNPNFERVETLKYYMTKKYELPNYQKLLLETGEADLHERPMRGKGDEWTRDKNGNGGDKMGQMLVQIRQTII